MAIIATILAALRWRASQPVIAPAVWPTYRLQADTRTVHRVRVDSATIHRARVNSNTVHRIRVDAR